MALISCSRYSSRMTRRALLIAATLGAWTLCLAPNAQAAADPFRAARVDFQRAYAQALLSPEELEKDSEALREYPLYSYVQAARIRTALGNLGPELGAADERA